MAGPHTWTEELIAQRVKDGRGQGVGEGWLPWMYVQEFSSKGTQTRIPGAKVKRTVHTFSYLERALFLFLEFQENFLGFDEQWPMDRRITLGAAASLKIRHPRYPKTAIPVVMTLDGVARMRDEAGEVRMAGWDVKPSRQLLKKRVAEKLSLHKAYCAHVGMPHYLFTENSVSRNVIRNIDWIRMSLPKDGELELVPGLFTSHPLDMLEQLAACRTRPTITHFCAQYDAANHLERGTGLRIMKLLLWHHRVKVDMAAQWIEREPIPRPVSATRASAPSRKAA